MAEQVNDRDAATISALAAVIGSSDMREAKRRVRELARTIDGEQLGVIWACVSVWERYPYEQAKAELRQLWKRHPAHQKIIEKLVPPTDPGIYRPPGVTLPTRPAGGRQIRARDTSGSADSRDDNYNPPPFDTRIDPSRRTGPTRPTDRTERALVEDYFGEPTTDQHRRAAAQRRRRTNGNDTIDDLELLDESSNRRFNIDDDKPFRRDSRKPFAPLDVDHDTDYDRDEDVDEYYRERDKQDNADLSNPLHGLPCVECRLERGAIDSTDSLYGLPYTQRIRDGRGDDGLCNPCRVDGVTGVKELPLGHTVIDAVNARCEHIAERYGAAARSVLRQEWRISRDLGRLNTTRAITAWVKAHPELPETPKIQATETTVTKRANRGDAEITTSVENGWCEGCSEFRQISDGQCVDCRPASPAQPSQLLRTGEIRVRADRTENLAAARTGPARRNRMWRTQPAARQVRRRRL